MQKLLAIATAVVVLSGGAALAQQASTSMQQTQPAPATQPPAQAAPMPDTPPPPPPPGPHGDPGGPEGGDWRADWRRGHRPPPSKAAHFRIEDGSVKIDVKCADDEAMKACADEINQILDRLEGSSSRDDDDRYSR